MEAEITLKELTDSLNEFENNKTPGCDGLTKEFYVTFWNIIGPKLLQTLQFCQDNDLLTQSQRRGIISLIHKQGKDPEQIENYRPISLLNVDYKILTKTLANRIQKKITKLVHTDQLGFIKERYIGEGVRKVNDIITHYEENGISGYILQLDFRKAFDSIEWSFLFDVLTKMNFGDQMIKWIKLCYMKIESCVINGGFASTWFALQKGLRQGCPLSAYLFLLCVEILANTIRSHAEVKGLQTGKTEQKLSMFADDCTCLVKDKASITLVINLIENFARYSGLELNHTKCELYKLKSNDQLDLTSLPFKHNTNNLTLLGITLGRQTEYNKQQNITEKQISITKKLNRWSQRNLSLIGKILVAKTYAMSKFNHTMSMTVVPRQELRATQKLINKFIWAGKPAKVKHTALINDYTEGGLRAPDVECQYKALKMPWLFRIYNSQNWNSVVNIELDKLGGIQLLLQCGYDKSTVRHLPTFYKEILMYWMEIVSPFGLRDLIVWNNKHIKVSNKTIFNAELYSKGVVFIHDFVKCNRTFLGYDDFLSKYNTVISVRQYNNVTRAIQRYLDSDESVYDLLQNSRPVFCANNTQFTMASSKIIDISKAKSKVYYEEFLLYKSGFPAAQTMWINKYNVDEEIFQNSLVKTKQATNESGLIAFQFKILHNILNTRDNLYKWGIQESDLCNMCGENSADSVVHAVTNCAWTVKAIKSFSKSINCLDKLKQVDKTSYLFGVNDASLNNIILVMKHTIHRFRQAEEPIKEDIFKKELYKRIISDRRALSKKNFQKKWSSYSELINEAEIYYNSLNGEP